MLQYDPADQLYPGDELFRAVTSLPKKKRKSSSNGPGRPSKKSKEKSQVFVDKVDLCVEIEKDEKDRRLCGDLTCFSSHVLLTRKMKNGGICAWCGIRLFIKCEKCGKYLHFFPQRGKVDHKVNCFVNFHDNHQKVFSTGYRLFDLIWICWYYIIQSQSINIGWDTVPISYNLK